MGLMGGGAGLLWPRPTTLQSPDWRGFHDVMVGFNHRAAFIFTGVPLFPVYTNF